MSERRHLGVVSAPLAAADLRAPEAPFAEELALAGDDGFDATGLTLYVAAGVRLEPSRIVEHDCGDAVYARGDHVVCETATDVAWGDVVVPSRRVLLSTAARLPRVLRRATPGDAATLAQLRKREQEVWRVVRDAARAIDLPVKVVRAEAAQGGARFVVYFASESKVSFREWLRGVGRASRERIDLRQIGLRDAARLIGGVGPCGLQLCCTTFLSDFTPVGIKAAKTQGLSTNPQRVSGVCGRLLCCLVYEEAQYRAARMAMPEPGDDVDTAGGRGSVSEIDVLRMRVSVELETGQTRAFAAAEVTRRRVE